jgi:hypothetical protein
MMTHFGKLLMLICSKKEQDMNDSITCSEISQEELDLLAEKLPAKSIISNYVTNISKIATIHHASKKPFSSF